MTELEHISSQNKRIAQWLNNGNSINPIDALNLFGCFRLSARIKDLKDKGMRISKKMLTLPNGKRYAVYSLQK